MTTPPPATRRKLTVPAIAAMKVNGSKIAMITAYDATFAAIVDAAGVDMILVGDSVATVVQGEHTTIPVTLDEMAYHVRMVARAGTAALVIGDLPFGSYQVDPRQAVASAVRLVKAGAAAVKLEGGVVMADTIAAITRVDIPVVGHIGLTPQSYHRMGGHRVQGRQAGHDAGGRDRLLDDAVAIEQAGAFALVIEGVPARPGGRDHGEGVDPDDRHRRRARLRRPGARAARRARAVRAPTHVRQAVRRPAHSVDRGHRGVRRAGPGRHVARRRALVPLSPPMDVLTTPATMHGVVGGPPRGRRRASGFVPTMGALHDGHLSLVDIAAAHTDDVVVSIFVNPLQFDAATDFDAYPRPIDDDVAHCRKVGVDAVYAPTGGAMYPAGFETHVEPGPLADVMEGAHRPGHFRGVTTVVTKLFGAVRPDVAVFGEKDFQQLAVIRRMTCDLDLGIEIIGAPIVRDPDGLAMSSRNVRLSTAEREAAVCVPRALDVAVAAAADGASREDAIAAAAAVIAAAPSARLEYVEVFDPYTLQPVGRPGPGTRVALAVWFGDVRLIDNAAVRSPASGSS